MRQNWVKKGLSQGRFMIYHVFEFRSGLTLSLAPFGYVSGVNQNSNFITEKLTNLKQAVSQRSVKYLERTKIL